MITSPHILIGNLICCLVFPSHHLCLERKLVLETDTVRSNPAAPCVPIVVVAQTLLLACTMAEANSGMWFADTEQGNDQPTQSTAKKHLVGMATKETLEMQLNHMICTAQTMQSCRNLEAVAYWTVLGPSAIYSPAKRATEEFNKRTRGQSGHRFGSPHVQAWMSLVRSLITNAENIVPIAAYLEVIKLHMKDLEAMGPEKAQIDLVATCMTKTVKDEKMMILKYALSVKIEPTKKQALEVALHEVLKHFEGDIRPGSAPLKLSEKNLQIHIDTTKKLLGKPVKEQDK